MAFVNVIGRAGFNITNQIRESEIRSQSDQNVSVVWQCNESQLTFAADD